MVASMNLTAADAALKVMYPDLNVKLQAYKNAPTLGMIPKGDFRGKNITYPVLYGSPQGASSTFTTAQNNKYASNLDDFVVTRVRFYVTADIDNETLNASEGDRASFLSALRLEVDGALHTAGRDLASHLFRTGSGAIGQLQTQAVSGTKLTLAQPADVVNFEVGMKTVCSTSTDGGDLDCNAAGQVITSIDRSNGILYYTTGMTNVTSTSLLYRAGDAQAGTSSALKKIAGFGAWVPSSAPSSTAFFGVNRAVDTSRLGGVRVSGAGKSVEEALIDGAAVLWREGGAPDLAVMNPEHMAELEKELVGRIFYDNVRSPDAPISFGSIKMRVPSGSIQVIADPNCPKGVIWLLTLSSWQLASLGPAPTIIQTDGLRVLRKSNADAVEVRCGYYGNLLCFNPGHNARIAIDT